MIVILHHQAKFGPHQVHVTIPSLMLQVVDSVITVNLTIRVKTFATINPDVCDSYTSPSGKVWTTSGTRNDTIPTLQVVIL